MTDPLDDFEHLNQVNRYRNRLDDIRVWRGQLTDIMLTISGFAMDLTGIRGTTSRIPGGDALTMLGPWAGDADHGDDLPHPDQIIREWIETLAGEPRRTWTENWRWLHDHTPQILESQWTDAWRHDIDTLWGRLAALTGNGPEKAPEPEITNDHVWAALEENPDHELTRRDLTHLGINASTVTTWRHRGKIQETRPGRYRAGDIIDARRTA